MARFRLFPCLVLICVCAAVEKFPLRKLESLAGRIAKADVKSVRNDARRARILASAVLGGVHAKKTTNTASKKERRNAPSNKAAWKELASQKATSKKTEKKIAALKVGIRNTKATISKWRKGSFQKKASHRTASKKTAPKRGASKKARPKKTARRTRSTKRAASMKTAWHMATHGKVATKEGEDIFLADSAAAKSRVTNSALTAKPILMQAERNVRTSWHRKVVKAQRAIGKTLQKAMTAIGKLAETESNKDRRKKGGPTKSKLIASMVSRERGDLKQVIASTARNIKKADSVFMHSTSEAFKRFDKAAAKTRKKVLKVTGNAASLEKKLEDGEKSAVAAMPARTKRVLRSLAQSEEADFENEMADEAHALQEQIKRKAKKSLRSMHKIFKKQGRYLRQLVETAKRRSKSAVTRARRRLTGKAKSHKSSKKARGASKTVKTQEKSHKSSKKARDASKTGKTQAKRRGKGAVTRAKKRVKDKGAVTRAKKRVKDKAKRKSKSAVTRAKRRSRDKAGGRIGYNYMEGADKLMKKFDATIKKQFQEVKVQGDQITKDTLKMGKEKSHKSSKKARHASKTGMGKAQAASNGFMKGAVEQLKKSAANEEHMFEQTTEKSHKASKRSRDASKSRKNEEKSHKSSKRSRDASKTRKNEEKSHKSSKRSRDASKTRKNEEKSHKSSKRSRDASKTRTNEEKSHKSSKRSRHASKTRKNEEESHKSSKRSRDASKTRKNEAKTARRRRSDRRRGQYPKARRAKLVTAEGFHMQARHKKLNQANKAELETSERKRSRRKAPKKANKAELKTSERKRSRRKAPKKARQSTRHTPDGFHLQEARQKHRKKTRKKPRTTGWTYEDLGAVRTPARTYQLEQLPQPSLPR